MFGEMIGLIKMDIICIKFRMQITFIIAIAIFSILGFYIGPAAMMPLYLIGWTPFYSMFIIGEKNNFGKLYGMLPIHKGSVAAARAIEMLLSETLFTVVVIGISYLFYFIGGYKNNADAAIFNNNIFNSFNVISRNCGPAIMGAAIFFGSCIIMNLMTCFISFFGAEHETPATLCTFPLALAIIFFTLSELLQMLFTNKISVPAYFLIVFLAAAVSTAIFTLITILLTRKREQN